MPVWPCAERKSSSARSLPLLTGPNTCASRERRFSPVCLPIRYDESTGVKVIASTMAPPMENA